MRVCGDAIDRAGFAPITANNHFDAGAVIVDHFRNFAAFYILIARRGHLHGRGQIAPQLKAVHLAVGVSVRHFLMQDAGTGGHPLHIPRAKGAGVAKAVAVIHGARQHIGDGFNAAMGMPRKALDKILGVFVAEIIEQQERVKL